MTPEPITNAEIERLGDKLDTALFAASSAVNRMDNAAGKRLPDQVLVQADAGLTLGDLRTIVIGVGKLAAKHEAALRAARADRDAAIETITAVTKAAYRKTDQVTRDPNTWPDNDPPRLFTQADRDAAVAAERKDADAAWSAYRRENISSYDEDETAYVEQGFLAAFAARTTPPAPDPAPQPGDAQPDAWQWQLNGNRDGLTSRWHDCTEKQAGLYAKNSACDVRPLYTVPPDTSAAVRMLAEALEPFAEDGFKPDQDYAEVKRKVFVGTLRRAAAALSDPRVVQILADGEPRR